MERDRLGIQDRGSVRVHEIVDALDSKRKQLDQEIARFREQKEREYQTFEEQLRGKGGKDGCGHDLFGTKRVDSENRAPNCHDGSEKGSRPGVPVQKKLQDEARPEDKGHPSVLSLNEASPRPHEREKEFQGLFTPTYLPLLDDKARDRRRSSELLEPPAFNPEPSTARRDSLVILSSSAECNAPVLTSPPGLPVRPLSSSVPGDPHSHRRRDSSTSDSLRSSIRRPNETREPRSPKRVLFSIDDTVVSPSTSPIAERSSNKVSTKTSASNLTASKGGKEFDIVRNPPGCDFLMSKPGRDGFSTKSQSSHWSINRAIPPTSSQKMKSRLPFISGDDFEHLEEDDLFSFDSFEEDLGFAEAKKGKEIDIEDDLDDTEDYGKEHKEPLIGSSPHAGSLPIEIKWPVRKDPRS